MKSAWMAGSLALATALVSVLPLPGAAGSEVRLSGAIFTTTVDGSVVNENVRYEMKEDVYLDGGPGPNAPVHAAALPEGDYYFQVTDPSGKDLLSTDHISCRKVRVNRHGVIDHVYAGTNWVLRRGTLTSVGFTHSSGIDRDWRSKGAITVQLFPYDDTPNPGGVYKVWLTRVEDYAGAWGDSYVPSDTVPVNGESYSPGNYHGFIPARCKTDNYKVKHKRVVVEPGLLSIRKFNDADLDGTWDAGEAEVTGWRVDVTDPLGVVSTLYTPALMTTAPVGTYQVLESTPEGTRQTVAIVDGVVTSSGATASPLAQVEVLGSVAESHAVVFGNHGLGSARGLKAYDRNRDGVAQASEPGIAGWRIQLTGTTLAGTSVGPTVLSTDATGVATFTGLVPGTYTLTELFPSGGGWIATGPTSVQVVVGSLVSGSAIVGSQASATFTNYRTAVADFGTKGYWHNKNGLSELGAGDIAYVNGLAPYSVASSYFGDGDEPFDGRFADGTRVTAAKGDWGDTVANAGTAKAEVSKFLVDTNASGDPREMLAQQLLAFLFNARKRLGDVGATFEVSPGTWAPASGLVGQAIEAWLGTDGARQHALGAQLDRLNNSDAVRYVPWLPGTVSYP